MHTPCRHQWSWGGAGEQCFVPENQHHKELVMDVTQAQKWKHFLRKLNKAKFLCRVLVSRNRGAAESLLTGNIKN